jgi:hypothetical protein
MTNQHPITPPPELVEQWRVKWSAACGPFAVYLATQAARWGADQELEACCEWLCPSSGNYYADVAVKLRAARRPKPPTLKEQALMALRQVGNCEEIDNATFDTIRKALEALPND